MKEGKGVEGQMRAGENGNWGPRLDNKTREKTGEELWESPRTFFEASMDGKTGLGWSLSLDLLH